MEEMRMCVSPPFPARERPERAQYLRGGDRDRRRGLRDRLRPRAGGGMP